MCDSTRVLFYVFKTEMETDMSDVTMTIDGAAVATEGTFDVVDPATGAAQSTAPDCTPGQLDAAMDSATKAFRDWRTEESARRDCLRAAGDALMAAAEEIAPILTAEQGKPLGEASMEVFGAAIWMQYYADLEIPRETIQDDDLAHVEVIQRPLGVVAAITPWNFPLVLAAWKIAPALLAGNTMVLKPSPFTPRSTLKLGEVLRDVLPPGVLNVVSGIDPLGASMTAHSIPRKISFTGSVATGKKVAAAAAPDLKRTTLELGGNDPAIVLDDVDVDTMVEKLFWGAFQNNGQVCSAVKRVYVPERLHDAIVDGLADRARSVTVAPGTEPEAQLGPINNRPQYDRVRELVDDAMSAGAVAAAGGHAIDGDGYFFEPTILANVRDGMRIVDEEQFGPALPVISYRDVDEVVERANATHFGLSGSVWSADAARATAIAEQLECGTAWINTHLALAPHQPFGGAKWSGIGVENGTWGLLGFSEPQVIHQARL